ncbi:nucleotidyltransferase family protein [Paludibacterium purpuratum]|uniref:Nucleotidyltransferase-like protein n=1 Tax=Paludibacterium purpuratum TaxID=1144873 RepID=A0A4R7B3S5_9NEIS|nr:nucleotidyltransferase family protein [Paludibacterium purpuratum]TDR76635.1 hypothetical protein DFP86_11061 [Paludibacterium purpuratum]
MSLLRHAREMQLPDWYIAAGAIRNTVWDRLHDYPGGSSYSDVDLIYFAAARSGSGGDRAIEACLNRATPGFVWEVVNQARVHEWYEQDFGVPLRPLLSSEDGMSFWPETATAVGVRLEDDDSLTIAAPLGLQDLFDLRLRWNDRQASYEIFQRRVEKKCFLARWPRLTLVDQPRRHG